MKFAANLNTLFREVPFLDRFAAAAQAGFRAVEILDPYVGSSVEVARALQEASLECALINLPRGDWDAGERGLACLPGREKEFETSIERALEYTSALRCQSLHVLAGLGPGSDATYVANLRTAARAAAQHGVTITIEPINHRDMSGYFLNTQAQAAAVLEEVGEPNLKMQMDCYHMQITEGDLETKLRTYIDRCGHIQIAGVPGRHEPDTGEVNYAYIFQVLKELGYDGWVGCEYHPAKGTLEGLGWRERLAG